MDELITELGTDINSSWTFKDGDLVLIENDENIAQSLANRLNNPLESMDLFYDEYGSYISSFLGWKQSEETLSFMKMEIEKAISQDPRFIETEVNLQYTGKGKVVGEINLHYDDDSDLSLSLVIDETGTVNVSNTETEEEIVEDDTDGD